MRDSFCVVTDDPNKCGSYRDFAGTRMVYAIQLVWCPLNPWRCLEGAENLRHRRWSLSITYVTRSEVDSPGDCCRRSRADGSAEALVESMTDRHPPLGSTVMVTVGESTVGSAMSMEKEAAMSMFLIL